MTYHEKPQLRGAKTVLCVPASTKFVVVKFAAILVQLVTVLERRVMVPRYHAVVWQVQILILIPLGSNLMSAKHVTYLEHYCEPAMGIAESVSPFPSQVSDNITDIKPRGEFVAATKATDSWKRMFKIWFTSNGTINKRRNSVRVARLTTDAVCYQWRVGIEIASRHYTTISQPKINSTLEN